MQESRLFKIVYYLLQKGKATAPELADKFEVSVRTIYRDIDALSGAGIPVYAETGRNGGIYLMSGFVLDKAVFSEEEKQEILTAMQSFNAVKNSIRDEMMEKLTALFQVTSENWLEIDFSRWGNGQGDNKKFELLKSAVIGQRRVQIAYAGSCEAVNSRIIQPLKLVYKSTAWYLKAYCTEKEDYRMFKLSRILTLEILEQTVSDLSYPEESDNPGKRDAGEQRYSQIRLRFPKEMACRVYDEFDPAQVEIQADGDFIVSARMPEDAWLVGFLLSFGTQVEILQPLYLKEILAKQGKLIYEKHKP